MYRNERECKVQKPTQARNTRDVHLLVYTRTFPRFCVLQHKKRHSNVHMKHTTKPQAMKSSEDDKIHNKLFDFFFYFSFNVCRTERAPNSFSSVLTACLSWRHRRQNILFSFEMKIAMKSMKSKTS